MLQRLKLNILSNLKNIPGWKTNRKIVVIECDDWGGIRMPSRNVLLKLQQNGLRVTAGWFNEYDSLESEKDLELLFEVLQSVKDAHNRPAVMTAMTNVANPDFWKIKQSGFTQYHYEPFTSTLKNYYPNEDVFKLWLQGIQAGIFSPELHGREHIATQFWMDNLRLQNKDLLAAFDLGFVFLDIPGLPGAAREFRSEYFFTSGDQKPFLVDSIKAGIDLFTRIFGRAPEVFVPPNGIFHPDFERVLANSGVNFLYTNHSMSYPVEGGRLKRRNIITGQSGPGNLRYYTRNCAFEPSSYNYPGLGLTLRQIEAAFRWGKPANISTHRVNFVGSLDEANRRKGLSEFRQLLHSIIKKWPDAEFMSSSEALITMKNCN